MKFFKMVFRKFFQFFSEDNGNLSNARMLAFFAVVSFIIDWQKHIWSGVDFNPSFTIVGFVLGVTGLKVVQKFTEVKSTDASGKDSTSTSLDAS
ncbi:hypothetical protein D4R99_05225 [bacterium]|nr:MAG: hypothetical protein D4R99_05225 [bacterium]